MFNLGISVIGPYLILLFLDEFKFHSRRGLVGIERKLHILGSAGLTGVFASLIFLPYGSSIGKVFWLALAVHFGAALWIEKIRAVSISSGEHVLHSLVFFMMPLVVGFTLCAWMFIDGASLLVGMILPVTTDGLRLLSWGVFGISLALTLWQAYRWGRSERPTEIGPVAAPGSPISS